MSEASVWCASCQRWWRPEQIVKRHKRNRAPDGGPSGRCIECRRADRRRAYWRVKADPERYAHRLQQTASYNRQWRARMTPQERAEYWRRMKPDPERAREIRRRYVETHHDELLEKWRARRREQYAKDPERVRALANARHQRMKARRFARRMAVRSDAAD